MENKVRQRVFARFALVLTAMSLGGGMVLGAQPAAAAAAAFTITMTSSHDAVQTGEPVDVEIAYSCSSAVACSGVVIGLPRPAGLFDEWSPSGGQPVATTSKDVTSVSVNSDKSVQFTFAEKLPAGSSGTIGVHYLTDNGPIAGGTKLVVTANASGANSDPTSTSVSVTLTATPAGLSASAQGQYPVYLDREAVISSTASASVWGITGKEGIGDLGVMATLPAGAVFVSADPAQSSVSADGTKVSWDSIPGQVGAGYYSRGVQMVVKFPAANFTSGRSVDVPFAFSGTSVGGSAISTTARATLAPTAFKSVFRPGLQVTPGSNYVTADTAAHAWVARGAAVGVGLGLNNFNSTVRVTKTVTEVDLPAEFTATAVGKPPQGDSTVSWRTDDGVTGRFSTADYPAPDSEDESPKATLVQMGVPRGAHVAHLTIVGPGIDGPGQGGNGVSGVIDGADRATVSVTADVTYSADGFDDIALSDTARFTVIDPLPVPSVWLYSSSQTAPKPGEDLLWKISLMNADMLGNETLRPVVYFPIPKGTKLAKEPVTVGAQWQPAPVSFEKPTTRVVHNDSLEQDVLVISWPENAELNSQLELAVRTVVTTAPAGALTARVYLGDARGPIPEYPYDVSNSAYSNDSANANTWTQRVRDDRDLDADGKVGGTLARAMATVQTGSGVGVSSQLEVEGSLDADFVTAPQTGATAVGQPIAYRLPIENTGNIDLSDMVVYDIFPHVGDTGVSKAAAAIRRNSRFAPILTGTVPALKGFDVWYSVSNNPCRPEVYPGLQGCDDNWTKSPADFGAVKALKFVQQDGGVLRPGDTSSTSWPMSIPADAPGGYLASNSVAFAVKRADTGAVVVAEPGFATVQVAQADLAVTLPGGELVVDTARSLGMRAQNKGPSNAPAKVRVTLPVGVTAAVVDGGEDPGDWSCIVSGQEIDCEAVGVLASGADDILPITLLADSSLVGQKVSVTATISGDYPDPDQANNKVTAAFEVQGEGPVNPTDDPTGPTDSADALSSTDPADRGRPSSKVARVLAHTGANALAAGGAAFLLVVLGVGAFIVRRRTQD